ncbi:MAG: hypothetical protein JO086_05125 [Acidimicrobiia bacterium]|nr:hypothetical protein [Acidimicrobiia bacterium]
MGRGIMLSVKWVVLVIVVILVAPTIAKRLEALDPERREALANEPPKKRGIVFRVVRRFGLGRVFAAFVLLLVILSIAVYLFTKHF